MSCDHEHLTTAFHCRECGATPEEIAFEFYSRLRELENALDGDLETATQVEVARHMVEETRAVIDELRVQLTNWKGRYLALSTCVTMGQSTPELKAHFRQWHEEAIR